VVYSCSWGNMFFNLLNYSSSSCCDDLFYFSSESPFGGFLWFYDQKSSLCILPSEFERHPRLHHKGATSIVRGRVQTGDQTIASLISRPSGHDIPQIRRHFVFNYHIIDFFQYLFGVKFSFIHDP
jgi:hypothetical protein